MAEITRRSFIRQTAGGLAAISTMPKKARATSSQQKPNIVYILCDDMGHTDLACFGHKEIKTPVLDKLTREGMKFTDCYAPAPVCSPTRGAFLTGRTPNRCRIYDHLGSHRWPHTEARYLHEDELTIPELLKTADYNTSLIGKWHLTQGFKDGYFNSKPKTTLPMPDDHGFDYYMATENNADPDHCNPKNFVKNGVAVGTTSKCSNDVIVDESIDWLSNTRDKAHPFFLFVSLHSPHEPIDTPAEYTAMYNTGDDAKNRYYGNITHIDAAVGRLLSYLDTSGLANSTFVMFTSDNGPEPSWHFWSHHPFGNREPFSCAKMSLYEGGIRVPGIIRWPGVVLPDSVSSEPISGVDMLPTFCEIAGVAKPTDRVLDGASITPVFNGKPVNRTQPLFWQYDYAESCNEHPEDHDGNKPIIVIRMGDWKLCTNKRFGHIKLYNLKTDKEEMVNVAAENQQRVNEMLATLKAISEDVKKEGDNGKPIIRQAATHLAGPKQFLCPKKNDIIILTLTGKRIMTFSSSKAFIDLKRLRLPKGLYLIRINNAQPRKVSSLARITL